MSETNPPLPSEDPPLTVSDDEVERLLSQAQSLAADIATLARVEQTPVSAAGGTIDLEKGDLDPAAATESLERSVDELAGLLGGPDGAASASPGSTPPAGPSTVPTPGATVADAGGTLADDAGPGPSTAGPGPSTAGPGSSTAGFGPTEAGGIPFDNALVGDVDVSLDEAASLAPPGGGIPAAGGSRPAAALATWRERLGTWRRRMGTAGGRLARRMPGGIVGFFLLLDRPFAGVPATAKRMIGGVAVVTLLMGLLAWLLPGLLESNPYAEVPL